MKPLRGIATIPTFEQYQRVLESTSSDQPAVHANQTIQQREDRNDPCSEILGHIKRTLEIVSIGVRTMFQDILI